MENGQFAELGASILRQLAHIPGLDKGVAKGWIGDPLGLRRALAKALVGFIFPLKVNYDLSVESLVAHGKYDWKDEHITSKDFPTTRKGEVVLETELVHFDKVTTYEEVIAELKRRELRPAELHELLTFGATYPKEQRKYSIVALGTVRQYWDSERDAVYLSRGGDGRSLILIYFGIRWGERCRFLAVRESSAEGG
jgi:hypothetical protein